MRKYFLVGLLGILCVSCENHYKNGWEISEYLLGTDTVLIKTPKDAKIFYEPSPESINKKKVVFKAPGLVTPSKITVYDPKDSSNFTYLGLEGSERVTKLRIIETGQ